MMQGTVSRTMLIAISLPEELANLDGYIIRVIQFIFLGARVR
jgi:hypothetical protein